MYLKRAPSRLCFMLACIAVRPLAGLVFFSALASGFDADVDGGSATRSSASCTPFLFCFLLFFAGAAGDETSASTRTFFFTVGTSAFVPLFPFSPSPPVSFPLPFPFTSFPLGSLLSFLPFPFFPCSWPSLASSRPSFFISLSTLTAADCIFASASGSPGLLRLRVLEEDATGAFGTVQPGTSNNDMAGRRTENDGGVDAHGRVLASDFHLQLDLGARFNANNAAKICSSVEVAAALSLIDKRLQVRFAPSSLLEFSIDPRMTLKAHCDARSSCRCTFRPQ